MRLIIQPDYTGISQWAADYVVRKIQSAQPTAQKPIGVVVAADKGEGAVGLHDGVDQ